MSDAGIALIAGGFALAGTAIGSSLTALGANWLQSKQRDHERELQRRLVDAEHRASDVAEARRLQRENLKPIFDVIDEMDRFLANRLWSGSYERMDFDDLPVDLKPLARTPENWARMRKTFIDDATKGLELSEQWRSIPIRAAWVALRINDAPDLQDLLIVAAGQVGSLDVDVVVVGKALFEFRRRFIEYAAKVETRALGT